MAEGNRLPRSWSLKSRLEIARLLRQGRRFSGDYFTLVWQPADRFGYAILVSKRHGTAVRRNRLRRLFREAIRLCRNQLRRPASVALLPGGGDEKLEFDLLKTDVCRAFEKLSDEL